MVWQVRRELSIARVAKEFGVLPSIVARDLDNDPGQLSLQVLPLLRYEEALRVYRRNDPEELKRWQGSDVMRMVEENDFAVAERQLAEAEEA